VNGDHGSAFAWQAEVSHMFASALGKIPVLGALFRYTSAGSSSNRMELVIFITPHIINPSND
jgi:Flp pilus assembly secretin CpaC